MSYPSGVPPIQPQPGPVLGGLAYWRKNPFLAASMVPIALTLVNGRFTAIDHHGSVVFDAHISEVSGQLASMGTLKLAVRGQKFALVGRGSIGGSEQALSQGQVQYLENFFRQFPQAVVQRGGAGPIDAAFNGAAAATLKVWRDALAFSGASVR